MLVSAINSIRSGPIQQVAKVAKVTKRAPAEEASELANNLDLDEKNAQHIERDAAPKSPVEMSSIAVQEALLNLHPAEPHFQGPLRDAYDGD